jgi:hypothetical protein
MMAPSVSSGLEVSSWECPDHPPPAYAMLQGPKVSPHPSRFSIVPYRVVAGTSRISDQQKKCLREVSFFNN